jgi:23S rRNA (uracil1939-C5)-methyltransferase
VESNALAVADARVNAGRAGLGNVRFEEADVRTALAQGAAPPGEAVILDPPRAGVEPGVIDSLIARAPSAIVYVSCDPPTLARDLARLTASGYRMRSVQAFDLFPDTFHLETVAVLDRG